MPYITPEMIAHAQIDVSNSYEADIIKGLNGLGGGKTMDQASPEVAKWFDRDCSVPEIMFSAMDHICSIPYGRQPTVDMIAAGNKVLEWMMNAAFIKPYVRNESMAMADVPLHLHPYVISDEPPCAHVYRKMREVGGLIVETPKPDITAELQKQNSQIEIIEKGGKIHCYRTEYRPVARRTYRIKIATQKASLACVSDNFRESMYDHEVEQLTQWLQARASVLRTKALAEHLETASIDLSRLSEALSVPSIACSLEKQTANAIWVAMQELQEKLIEAGFPEPR